MLKRYTDIFYSIYVHVHNDVVYLVETWSSVDLSLHVDSGEYSNYTTR